MNITLSEYKRIVKNIEYQRYLVADTMIRNYPWSVFDYGGDLSRNRELNELYKLLDESITKEEMQIIYPLKIYEPRENQSLSPLSDNQGGNTSR